MKTFFFLFLLLWLGECSRLHKWGGLLLGGGVHNNICTLGIGLDTEKPSALVSGLLRSFFLSHSFRLSSTRPDRYFLCEMNGWDIKEEVKKALDLKKLLLLSFRRWRERKEFKRNFDKGKYFHFYFWNSKWVYGLLWGKFWESLMMKIDLNGRLKWLWSYFRWDCGHELCKPG